MKKMLFLPFVLCSVVACQAESTPPADKTDTAQTTQSKSTQTQQPQATEQIQAIDNKAKGVWIDVRSADEFKVGHLAGAVNIVHNDIASQIASVAPNKDEPIHLYCRSGSRAEAALQELKKLGYTNITNHGGYDNLVKQGLK